MHGPDGVIPKIGCDPEVFRQCDVTQNRLTSPGDRIDTGQALAEDALGRVTRCRWRAADPTENLNYRRVALVTRRGC